MKMKLHDLKGSRVAVDKLLGELGTAHYVHTCDPREGGLEPYSERAVLRALRTYLTDNAELFAAYAPGSRALSRDGGWHVEEEWRRRAMAPDQLLAFMVPGADAAKRRLAEKTFLAWSATNRLGKDAELRWLDETEASRARLAYTEAWDAEPPEGEVLLVRWDYYHPSQMEAMGH